MTETILTQIDNQDLKRHNDLNEYAKAPWLTLEEFENNLKDTSQNYTNYYTKVMMKYERKIENLKKHFLFREEALEEALKQIKIDRNEKIEQSQMAREDVESQFTKFIQ